MARHVAENRKSYRFPFRGKFIFGNDSGVYAGNALNLSSGGVFVATFEAPRFQRGMTAHCLFQPHPEEAPLAIEAQVQRIVTVGPNPDEIPGVGFSFRQDASRNIERLEEFALSSRKSFEAAFTILTAGEPDRSTLDPLISRLHLPPFLDLGELRFHVERILKGLEGLDNELRAP